MPEYTLTANTPLDGFSQDFVGVSIKEVNDRAIVSIAVPKDGEKELVDALASSYQIELPKTGLLSASSRDNAVLFSMAQDQYFFIFDYEGNAAASTVRNDLGEAVYLTDQSDSYVMIRLSGINSRRLLSRICPVDIHPSVFPVGSVARTIMEHLGATIIHEGEDSFLLLSARSSAHSFLESIEMSAVNIEPIS
ncbi:sarcosine oxidase subunit gamma [uncultured Kiloniella sp.]|uniref:sarcosine oxidase subunit gamma n=1 Tax=uncultured Kiloniella sp. TaxID=1133091 RepID=UPI00260392F8|nr:sarcosine oxidase subunit gamma family protein [uncultured Kiloniella sp.]